MDQAVYVIQVARSIQEGAVYSLVLILQLYGPAIQLICIDNVNTATLDTLSPRLANHSNRGPGSLTQYPAWGGGSPIL